MTTVENQDWVGQQLERRGIRDPRVLDVMRTTPRQEFVAEDQQAEAYRDGPLPIGFSVTISQPFIVALMTELLAPQSHERILEIGTGSGYQTAVLAQMAGEVFSVEVIPELSRTAFERLRSLGLSNIHLRTGDGALGWPEFAPFDGVIVTAAPAEIPPALIEQLRPGGRLVCPVGTAEQDLTVVEKGLQGGVTSRRVIPVSFVPLIHPEA